MDFRTPHTIGSCINEPFQQLVYGAGYDHNYVINKQEAGTLTFAAKCVEPISGRTLEVYTTEPGVQVYTANWHSGFAGWHGATFPHVVQSVSRHNISPIHQIKVISLLQPLILEKYTIKLPYTNSE